MRPIVIFLLVMLSWPAWAGQIYVKAKPGRSLDEIHGKAKGRFKQLVTGKGHGRWERVTVPDGDEPLAVSIYRLADEVETAEAEVEYRIEFTPDDPYLDQQWVHVATDAQAGWDVQRGAGDSDVVIFVSDTGVRVTHEDLASIMLPVGPNGEYGARWSGGVMTWGGQDVQGHGTHVASIAASRMDNGLGVAGAAGGGGIKVVSLAFLGAGGGGSSGDAAESFFWLADWLTANPAKKAVVSCSWGGGGYSEYLLDSMKACWATGRAIFIFAAGNNARNMDVEPHYPGSYDWEGIVSVQSIARSGTGYSHSGFTNYGSTGTDIGAPGSDIYAAIWSCDSCYGYKSGTSMATPEVSGVTALVWNQFPTDTGAQIKNRLLNPASFKRIASDVTMQSTTQGGVVNVLLALTNTNPPMNHPPTALDGLGFPDPVRSGESFSPPTDVFTDPDGDSLQVRVTNSRGELHSYMVGLGLIRGANNTLTSRPMERDVVAKLVTAASDGRGGGAMIEQQQSLLASQTGNRPPVATAAVEDTGISFRVRTSLTDPDGDDMRWVLVGTFISDPLKPTDYFAFGRTYAYRVTIWAMDTAGNLAETEAVIQPGTVVPPRIRFTQRSITGVAPLTVTVPVTVTGSGDVWISNGREGNNVKTDTLSVTYSEPGVYWPHAKVIGSGAYGYDAIPVVVLAGGDVTPPPPPPPPPPSPECGDGSCNGDETCVTCPADCGECPPPPPPPPVTAPVLSSTTWGGRNNDKHLRLDWTAASGPQAAVRYDVLRNGSTETSTNYTTAQFTNAKKGTYSVRAVFANGQIVTSNPITHQ